MISWETVYVCFVYRSLHIISEFHFFSTVKRQTSYREDVRNKIIGNWKYIKSNINLDSFAEKCLNEDLVDFNDFEKYNELPKSQKIDVILTTIVRNIEDASDFENFLKVLDQDEHEHHIADKLKLSETPGNVNDGKTLRWCMTTHVICFILIPNSNEN